MAISRSSIPDLMRPGLSGSRGEAAMKSKPEVKDDEDGEADRFCMGGRKRRRKGGNVATGQFGKSRLDQRPRRTTSPYSTGAAMKGPTEDIAGRHYSGNRTDNLKDFGGDPTKIPEDIAKPFKRGGTTKRRVTSTPAGSEGDAINTDMQKTSEIDAGDEFKRGGRLTAAERQAMPKSDFALPGKGKGPKGAGAGSYPIEDEGHARAALSRVSANGTPSEKAAVRRKVHEKYPEMGQS